MVLQKNPSIDSIVEILRNSQHILFITGAGLSADSGLPTYRGIGGLYNHQTTDEGIPIEETLSGQMMASRPEITWKYLARIIQSCLGAKCNRGHEVIAEMEKHFERVWVLTQNVDGFHRDAGSQNVIDIHGDIHDLRCTSCNFHRRLEEFTTLPIPPRCPECGQVVRPDVVLFGEMLPMEKLELLEGELQEGFSIIFSVGTTSVFPYIAAPIWQAQYTDTTTVEINPGESEVSPIVDYQLTASAAPTLDTIWTKYQEES